MGKSVHDLFTDIEENKISSHYAIYVLDVELDSDNEVIGQKSPVPVERIEVDHSSSELLLHKKEGAEPVLVEALRVSSADNVLKYDVCAAEEYTDTDTSIRIDTPLIGIGENHEEERFFVVCEVSD